MPHDNRRSSNDMLLTPATLLRLARLVVAAATIVAPRPGWAQAIEQVATMPPNLALPNYDTVPSGPFGGLESGAYVARVSDPSSAWFNPAGLSTQGGPQASASGGVYQWIAVSPEGLPHSGGSVQHIPNFVGGSFHIGPAVAVGAAFLTTNAWLDELDSEQITTAHGGEERVGYSADSLFSRRIAAAGAAYELSPAWRVGVGLAISLTDLRLVQSISDRVIDTAGLRTLIVSARASGSVVQLRAQGGVQYTRSRVRAAGAIRSPGLTVHREGAITMDGIVDGSGRSLGSSLFDANAAFDLRLPWEVQAGAAYVRDRAEVEVDIRTYTSVAPYPLLATGEPTRIYGELEPDTAPTIGTRPFGPLTSASDATVDVTIGGHIRPVRDRSIRVHGGFATHHSPVTAVDDVFNRVDLWSWNVGISGTVARFQFAVGFDLRTGSAADVIVRNVVTGGPIHRNVGVRAGGLIYSVAFQF